MHLLMNWLSTRVQIHENQGPQFARNYILAKEQKRDEPGASFQSSPKKKPYAPSQDSFAYNESLQHPTI